MAAFVAWIVVGDPGDQVAIDPADVETFGFVVVTAGVAITNPEQEVGGLEPHVITDRLLMGVLGQGLRPAVDEAWPRQGHGGASQDQHVIAIGQQRQVANREAAEIKETQLQADEVQGKAVGVGFTSVVQSSEAKVEHHGDAPQERPAQPHQHPVTPGGDAFDVDAVVLAGDGQEWAQQRFGGDGGGEEVFVGDGVEAEPLAAAGPATSIKVQTAEHLDVGAAPWLEHQRLALVGVVPGTTQAVGPHQPEPVAIKGQTFEVGFTISPIVGKAEISELHPGRTIMVAMQPMEVAALIACQPQPTITTRQAREVVTQANSDLVIFVTQEQPTLVPGECQGKGRQGEASAAQSSIGFDPAPPGRSACTLIGGDELSDNEHDELLELCCQKIGKESSSSMWQGPLRRLGCPDQTMKVAATSERRISRVSGSMGDGSKPRWRYKPRASAEVP